jgi:hypothetical protein
MDITMAGAKQAGERRRVRSPRDAAHGHHVPEADRGAVTRRRSRARLGACRPARECGASAVLLRSHLRARMTNSMDAQHWSRRSREHPTRRISRQSRKLSTVSEGEAERPRALYSRLFSLQSVNASPSRAAIRDVCRAAKGELGRGEKFGGCSRRRAAHEGRAAPSTAWKPPRTTTPAPTLPRGLRRAGTPCSLRDPRCRRVPAKRMAAVDGTQKNTPNASNLARLFPN